MVGYLGFLIAAYAVIANDIIQTLGTFLSSNHKRPWYVLWGFAGLILVLTLVIGWIRFQGDVSYGRLDQIPLPEKLHWWYLIAPLALLIVTRFGIPVSTTFMILSVFSTTQVIEKMLLKSLMGYVLAFVSAFLIYLLIARSLESKASLRLMDIKKQKKFWLAAQWGSTAFLWTQWLIQDFANIFVFLPRSLSLNELLLSIAIILALMAYTFQKRGGKIQEVVNKKVNTQNIRSATLIDLSYGLLLMGFGNLTNVPMSTTWAFIGILAGREVSLSYSLNKKEMKSTYKVIGKDLTKVNLGLAISILVAYFIKLLE
jgi:Phosphate/sulphate permeases